MILLIEDLIINSEILKEQQDSFPLSMSSDDITSFVDSIHRNPEDFEEGDIVDRLYNYDTYTLKRIPIASLDLEEWDVQEYLVKEIEEKIRQNKKELPIIVNSMEHNNYSIIDGIHRANAFHNLGYKDILAYVGDKK